ncbi:class I adenylate-forming enzyme family protein [Streptosporangium sp. NPDC001681]|uniref:class I adenylate-forming enzyme family protein n=1 Tax=Streptosporangium sp. NPDC001681 TaxID=3154395 RepID=UPI0033246399
MQSPTDIGSNHTIIDLLDRTVARFGDRVAIVDGPTRYTYRDLRDRVDRAAAGLRALGVGKGDRVAIWLPNRVEWAVAFFGAVHAGAVVVPINTVLSVPEAQYQIEQSGARVLVVADEFRSRSYLDDALRIRRLLRRDLTVVVVGGSTSREVVDWADVERDRPERLSPSSPVEPADPVVILYTSGTTGLPKGAVHTHRFLPSLLSAAQRLRLTEQDCVVLYLPLFHVYALMAGLVLLTSVGAKLVLMERFQSTQSLELMAAERATVVYGVPTTYIDQLNDPAIDSFDLSSVRVSITPFAYDLAQKVSARFGRCLNCFGMTETASMALLPQLDDPSETALRTVGTPLDGLEVKVVDDLGAPVMAGTPGSLRLRGPLITTGYHNKLEETAKVFDEDGWFNTGDIAWTDADGNVTFVGRHGDAFRVGGESVDPVEVETALHTHPVVDRAAVVGIPNERLGFVPCAWVQLHKGMTVAPEELVRHAADRLASFKVPRIVKFIDQLPTTPSGKVQKYRLLEASATSPDEKEQVGR